MRSVAPHFIALGALAAAPALAQNIPVRALAKPEAEYSEPLTAARGARELKDGRVIVVDPRDKVVQVVDFKAGSSEKIGREGSGPGEFSLPQSIFALPGDSSAVSDPLNRRLLVITPNAKPGGFIDVNAGGGAGGRGMMFGGISLSAVDSRGRFYMQGSPIRMTDAGAQTFDSVAIERWDRAANKHDTLAYLHLPKGNTQASGGRGQMQIRIGGSNPFAPQDQWAAASDGRVAVVSANDYHITWVDANGRRATTPPIKYDRMKVSEAHKQEWRDSRKSQLGLQVQNVNGKMSAQSVPMTNAPEPDDWPEYMPPFLGNALSFSPDGLLWVRRTGPAGQAPTYDLIDGSGKVTQRVVFPKKTRLLGFGANGAVYTVRIDDDDLEYLQRYRFNAAERP